MSRLRFGLEETANGWLLRQGGKVIVFEAGAPEALGEIGRLDPRTLEHYRVRALYRALEHAAPDLCALHAEHGVGLDVCARPSAFVEMEDTEPAEVPDLAGEDGDAELLTLDRWRKSKEEHG